MARLREIHEPKRLFWNEPEFFQAAIERGSHDIHTWAAEKGWWDGEEENPRNLYEQIALMHSELSEAVEELRNGHLAGEVYYDEDESGLKPEGFGVELADVVIRIMDTCARYEIPLGDLIVEKMRYNETRGYRHGGKRA